MIGAGNRRIAGKGRYAVGQLLIDVSSDRGLPKEQFHSFRYGHPLAEKQRVIVFSEAKKETDIDFTKEKEHE